MESPKEQPSSVSQSEIQHPIIFFDGVCGLCNKFVDRLLRLNRDGRYKFSPLQGETARKMLGGQPDNPTEWSIIFIDENGVYKKSTAVLRILTGLGGVRKGYSLLFIFPCSIRDRVYEWVAVNRYKWFGKKASCRIPTKEEKSHFLP